MHKTLVAVTGASGAMGAEVVKALLESEKGFSLRIFLFTKDRKKMPKFLKSVLKAHPGRVETLCGDLAERADCDRFVAGADYIFHCAAVIPPHSDHSHVHAERGNYIATKNLVDAVVAAGGAATTRFIHVSTVALYGHRTYKHPWIRIGDPLLPSIYDNYALFKLKAERYVLESPIRYWVSLRQTAVLHKYLFTNNLQDGLMFHTPWNAPFEWATDRDSGLLCKHLAERDSAGHLPGFWRRCYNVGGGYDCRVTGYETITSGFSSLGRTAKSFFKPHWNAARNFHGGWFADSKELESYCGFQRESHADFWNRMAEKYWYFKLGAAVPSSVISLAVFKRLLRNTNAPAYWVKRHMEGRINAFFGSQEGYAAIPRTWDNYLLLCEGKTPEGEIDYDTFKDDRQIPPGMLLEHGYDTHKADTALDIEDMRAAAEYRGGLCLSEQMTPGDLYTKLEWMCCDGHRFFATPYAVLKAGHWCETCEEATEQYNELVKKVPFYAQIWYDSHDGTETDTAAYAAHRHCAEKEGRYARHTLRFFRNR